MSLSCDKINLIDLCSSSWLRCIWQQLSLKFCWVNCKLCIALQQVDRLKNNKKNAWTQGVLGKHWKVKIIGTRPVKPYNRQKPYKNTVCFMSVYAIICNSSSNMFVGMYVFSQIWLCSVFLRSTSRSQHPHQSRLPLFASSPSTYPVTAKTNLKPALTASINMFQGMELISWNLLFSPTVCSCIKTQIKYF